MEHWSGEVLEYWASRAGNSLLEPHYYSCKRKSLDAAHQRPKPLGFVTMQLMYPIYLVRALA